MLVGLPCFACCAKPHAPHEPCQAVLPACTLTYCTSLFCGVTCCAALYGTVMCCATLAINMLTQHCLARSKHCWASARWLSLLTAKTCCLVQQALAVHSGLQMTRHSPPSRQQIWRPWMWWTAPGMSTSKETTQAAFLALCMTSETHLTQSSWSQQ